jgi:pimeloyl-ACP methyl ester carboxylesterase
MRLWNPSNTKDKNKIRELPVTFGNNGLKLTGKVLLPVGASADSRVPGAVLCHGFGSSHRAMQDSARIMSGQGIATFIFDFRGHGISEGAVDGRQADDAVDAWNTLKQFPEIDKNRMGLIGHSLGAMSAIMAAGKVDSPKALIALSCPPIIDAEMLASGPSGYGRWGSKHSRIVEYPREGTFPWITGAIAIAAARLWMYTTGNRVRIDVKKFVEGITRMNMAEVLGKLDTCAKLFVFCLGDTITPYLKSVPVYETACEPKLKLLDR